MATVSRGGSILLTVQFYEFVGGPPFDPTETAGYPELRIFKDSTEVAGPYLYSGGTGPVTKRAVGDYSYAYEVPDGADVGTYTARWTGTIHGSTVVGQEYFEVVVAGSASTGFGSAATLVEDFELEFTSGATILYLDPEELMDLFSDASYTEVLDWVAFYTLEVKNLLGLEDDDPAPIGAREYIRAAVACALSRIYDWSGGGVEDAIRLGDFSVEGRTTGRVLDTRATATTWCELAALLRAELVGTARAGMRGVVRGDAWENPMPVRSLRHVEKN